MDVRAAIILSCLGCEVSGRDASLARGHGNDLRLDDRESFQAGNVAKPLVGTDEVVERE